METPVVNIRPAAASDLEALVDLLGELFALEADFTPDRARQLRGLEMLLGRGDACLLVAEAGGTVRGMCSGQIVISTVEGGYAALVEDVVVQGDWRGRGVGKRLLAALAGWAREKGATRMQLVADRDNGPALHFYRHLGWSETNLVCLRHRGE